MDYRLLKERIVAYENDLIAVREGPYGYMRASVRYDREMPKIARIKAKLDNKIEFIERLRLALQQDEFWHRSIRRAYSAFRSGKRFLSLDIERTYDGVIEEIGVTIFRLNSTETFNYIIDHAARGVPFDFGKTMHVTSDQAKALIRSHINTADLMVGQSIHKDLEALREAGYEFNRPYYYDTAQLSKARFGFPKKLVDLARYYNVGAKHFHCAGNDSRYTADVFLKMIHEDVT